MATARNQRQKRIDAKSMAVSDVTGRDSLTEEGIRFHAYMLYQERQRTGAPGDAVSDWLRAQSELAKATRQMKRTHLG
jgi:hypothetical protein